MTITAFSIADGDKIEAVNADYETYKYKLPLCGTCFSEVCLARGEHKVSYWHHLPISKIYQSQTVIKKGHDGYSQYSKSKQYIQINIK